jgi:hypothetical protein
MCHSIRKKKKKKKPPYRYGVGRFFLVRVEPLSCDYFCDGAATAFATGVAGAEWLLFDGLLLEGETVVCETATVGVAGALGLLGADDVVVTVLTVSFSGQNKIARIAMTSNMITIVGQWAFVNDQNDDACAVCAVLLTEGVVPTAGVGVMFAATLGWVGAVAGIEGVLGATLFTAGAELTATGADADVPLPVAPPAKLLPALPLPLVMLFAIATRVLCMPVSVACTVASCDGVSVVLTASDVFNCVSVAESVFKVP